MKPIRAILVAVGLAVTAQGAPDAATLLRGTADDGPWEALVTALASQGAIRSSFTERRYFSIRTAPTVLKGTLRISPERGLSLQYLEPDPLVLIVDPAGLILREHGRSDRKMAAGSREAGAIASLLPVMRFDVKELASSFFVRASGDLLGWTFEFTPKDPAVARTLGTIVVQGRATEVKHIVFRRSQSQRIEIDVGETTLGASFSQEEIRQFFRGPETR
jgi:hypothetical protein